MPIKRKSLRYVLLITLLLLTVLSVGGQDILPLPNAPGADKPRQLPADQPFTVAYPVDARPANMTRKFKKPAHPKAYMGIDLHAPAGTAIMAGAPGKVKKVVPAEDGLGLGAYVRVKTKHAGEKYFVIYAHLTNIQVSKGDIGDTGTTLGYAVGDTMTLIVQHKHHGYQGFPLKHVVKPKKYLVIPEMRVRPVDNGLFLRSGPSTDFDIVGQVNRWDLLLADQPAYKVLWFTGRDGKWLRVLHPISGEIVYAAAWFLEAVSADDFGGAIPGVPVAGMNLDLDFHLGTPSPEPLLNLGWVRMSYNLSYNPSNNTYGNTDINATYQRYQPVLNSYAASGNKVILVLTHQFYGEGAGFVWEQMNSAKWRQLSNRYAELAGQVAQQYAGQNIIYAYQIWNEQDTEPNSGRAAVPMPAEDYAYLLTTAYNAISASDPGAKIITGGHISGPDKGPTYARTVLSNLPVNVQLDGIAFHPYGRGPVGSQFNQFGTIDESLQKWSGVLPAQPLWITEWGILDYQGDMSIINEATFHALRFIQVVEQDYPHLVAAAVWYAWADGMDNGYGMVSKNNVPKEPLYSAYLGTDDVATLLRLDLNRPLELPARPKNN